MTQSCYSAGCVAVGRIALIDECSNAVIEGPTNGYAFGGVVTATWTPQIEQGETTTVKDMCGNICVRDLQCDQTVGYQVEISLCRPDNELISLVTGEPAILDIDGNTVGYAQSDDSNCAPYVALELFEKIPESACTDANKYRRIVFPKIRLTQGPPERQGPIRLLKLTGTSESGLGTGYGDGVYHDSPIDFAVAFPDPERFHIAEFYDAAAPDPQCGYISTGASVCIPPPVATYDSAGTFASEELSIFGNGFLPLTAVGISAENYVNGPFIFAYNPAYPGAAALNTANNITIITWTDSAIEITSSDLDGIFVSNVTALQCGFDIVPENINGPTFNFPNDGFYIGPVPTPSIAQFDFTGNCDDIASLQFQGVNLNGLGSIHLSIDNVTSNPAGPATTDIVFYRPGSLAETNLGPNQAGITSLIWSHNNVDIQIDTAIYGSIGDWAIVSTTGYDQPGTSVATATFNINQDPCTTGYVQEVSDDNPIAYWRMNDASGGAIDSSGNSRNLSEATVSSLTYLQAALVNGGSSISGFSTPNKWLTRNDATLSTLSVPLTLEAFIKTGAIVSGIQTIIELGTGIGLKISGGKIAAFAGTNVSGVTSLTVSTRYHVALVLSGGNVQLFLNGVAEGPPTAITYTPAGTTATVGSIATGASQTFNAAGLIEEVAVYNTALTAQRISAHYASRNN